MKKFFGSMMVIFLVAFATVMFNPACGEIGDPLYPDSDGDNPAVCSPELCRNGRLCVLVNGAATCVDGVVSRECMVDIDCADFPKRICGDGGVCKDNPYYCDAQKACLASYECKGNTCTWVGQCTVDADCLVGQICDNNTRKCVPNEGECTVDADCLAGQECRSKVCVDQPSGDDDDITPSFDCSRCEIYRFGWATGLNASTERAELYSLGGDVFELSLSEGVVRSGELPCSRFNPEQFNARVLPLSGGDEKRWASQLRGGGGEPYLNGPSTLECLKGSKKGNLRLTPIKTDGPSGDIKVVW